MKSIPEITYQAEPYTGRKLAIFFARTGWQVTALDAATGKRRAVFAVGRGKSPCLKMGWVARHFRSGRSAKDESTYQRMRADAIAEAARLNSEARKPSVCGQI